MILAANDVYIKWWEKGHVFIMKIKLGVYYVHCQIGNDLFNIIILNKTHLICN